MIKSIFKTTPVTPFVQFLKVKYFGDYVAIKLSPDPEREVGSRLDLITIIDPYSVIGDSALTPCANVYLERNGAESYLTFRKIESDISTPFEFFREPVNLRADARVKDVLALPQYQQFCEAMFSSEKPLPWGLLLKVVGITILLGFVVLVGGIGFSAWKYADQVPVQMSGSIPLDAPTSALDLSQPGGVDQLSPSELEMLKTVVGESGVSRTNEGDPFVIFSDPNCPSCRAFEAKMKELNLVFNPLIVPVAFQKGSEDAVAGIFCAKDVAKAWDDAIKGKVAPACPGGREQVRKNNATFVALRFDSTPTFVSAKGKLAKGATNIEGLLNWVKTNYPAGITPPTNSIAAQK